MKNITEREKIIDFKGLFRDFFGSSENTISKESKEIKSWKDEYKEDLGSLNATVYNLEKMLEHSDKKPTKRREKEDIKFKNNSYPKIEESNINLNSKNLKQEEREYGE